MNDKQTRVLNMALVTQETLEDNNPLWGAFGAITAKKTLLDTEIGDIPGTQTVQEADNTGHAEDKNDKKFNMATKAEAIAATTAAYAEDTSNEVLFNLVNYPFSDLFYVTDTRAAERCQEVHDLANANLGDMGEYPIDAAQLGVLQADINAYNDAIGSPRVAESVTVAATAQLTRQFTRLGNILRGMDKLIAPFKLSNLDFYDTYTAARVVNDIGVRLINLRVIASDAASGVPLVKATVTATLLTDPANPIELLTGSTGKANFKSLPTGPYDVLISITGFQDVQLQNIPVFGDRLNTLEVEMDRD